MGTVFGPVVVVGSFYFLIQYLGTESVVKFNSKAEFRRTYDTALRQYADTDHDRTINPAEITAFDRELFHSKPVKYQPQGWPQYQESCTPVPIEIVTEWVRQYRPKIK